MINQLALDACMIQPFQQQLFPLIPGQTVALAHYQCRVLSQQGRSTACMRK